MDHSSEKLLSKALLADMVNDIFTVTLQDHSPVQPRWMLTMNTGMNRENDVDNQMLHSSCLNNLKGVL